MATPETVTICVASNKGGVGKTTTATQIGTGLSRYGREIAAVVIIDGDSQGNVGDYLGLGQAPDLANALRGTKTVRECMKLHRRYNKLWVMRSDESTWEVERYLVKGEGSENHRSLGQRLESIIGIIENELAKARSRVLIVIDTPPSFSDIQTAALVVSDYVLAPMTPGIGGEAGAISMQDWIVSLGDTNKKLGILPQMIDLEDPDHKMSLSYLENVIGEEVIYPPIPRSPALASAQNNGQFVWDRGFGDEKVHDAYAATLQRLADDLGLKLNKMD